ncbi:MAG: CPBP family intramembrane metalloprotease [Bacilli bacterium]|nr:CPBP family intramembrane metalloprotease [Bacilli bacterium]
MKKYKDLFIALLTFLLYFLFSPLIEEILHLFNINIKNLNIIPLNIILIVVDLSFMGIVFLIHKNEIIKDFKEFIGNKGKWFFKYIGLFIGSVVVMGALNLILSKITNMSSSENEELVRELIKKFPVYMAVSTILYAPFVEEILFRKCVRKIIPGNDKLVKIAYILISAIIFGLVHVISLDATFNDFLMGIPYMVVGLSLGYIYIKTDNVFATMQFHLMHNTILLILQLVMRG